VREVVVDGLVVTHRGVAPFVARSASDKTEDWPFWFVCGQDRINYMYIEAKAGTYGAKFCRRKIAERIAEALNET
jgi:hypothetical protein